MSLKTASTHIRHISSKASTRLYALRILRRNGVQPSDLRTVYIVVLSDLSWNMRAQSSIPRYQGS